MYSPKETHGVDFLHSSSSIGGAAFDRLVEFLRPTNTKILINLGLSGAGKSHMLYCLAVDKKYYVLLYDCYNNPGKLEDIIEDYWMATKRHTSKLHAVTVFADWLELLITNFTLANAFTLLHLIKTYNIQPDGFLHYLENGGKEDIKEVFDVIRAEVHTVEAANELKAFVVEEIANLTRTPVIEAWNEATVLAGWADGEIPFNTAPNNPIVLDRATGSLKNGGNAFTVACRVAHKSEKTKTIFCGRALRLLNLEDHITNDRLKRVTISTGILHPWGVEEVEQSLREDLNLEVEHDGQKKLLIEPKTLDTIIYILQGRPSLVTVFKHKLYDIKADPPDDVDPNDINGVFTRY